MYSNTTHFFVQLARRLTCSLVMLAIAGMVLSQPSLILHALEHLPVVKQGAVVSVELGVQVSSTDSYTQPMPTGSEGVCVRCIESSVQHIVLATTTLHQASVPSSLQASFVIESYLRTPSRSNIHQRGPPQHLV